MRTLERLSSAAAALLVALAAGPARAQVGEMPTMRDITSVRAAGMGGATRGFASSDEALMVNPAAIAGTIRFNFDASAVLDPPHGYRVFSASAVDSKINAEEAFPLSGGIGYHYYGSGKGDADRHGHVVTVGLALPLVPEQLFIGVAPRYMRLEGAVKSNSVNFDAAAMYKPSPLVGISAIGYNLLDVQSPESRRSYGFGLAVGSDLTFHVDVDARLEQDLAGKWIPSFFGGAEYLIEGVVVPRLGYAEDRFRAVREVTGGVSVLLSGLAIEAFYAHALNGEGRRFGLALRLLDWSL